MKPSTVAILGALASVAQQADATDKSQLTPRQKQGLAGGEACLMLCAHPGKLDEDEMQTLGKAGLIFGAVLAGER